MDFHFSDDQQALRDLAAKVISDFSAPARLADVERSGRPYDADLWSAAGAAGLLGAGLSPPFGAGMGVTGACLVLEEIGRRVTPLPAWTSSCTSALTIDRFGSPSVREELLPRLAEGSVVCAAALEEPFGLDPTRPGTTGRPDGSSWVMSGQKAAVAYGPVADFFLVSAATPGGETRLFVVSAGAPGLEVQPGEGTTGEPVAEVLLDGVVVDASCVLQGAPGEAAAHAYRVGLAGLCATAAGVLDGGLTLTGGYIAERRQFDRPIATFQGAAMRIADAYIDTQAVWVSAWSAIWKLDAGRPADEALAIAKFWAADGGQRAAHAFQHLHGGMGMDVAYPVHRYFVWAKALEVAFGGAGVQLERLGQWLAAGAEQRSA